MNWQVWMAITILLFFITGFTGGWIFAASLGAIDVAEQCSEFIQDHCLCYENKPATEWNTVHWDGRVGETWNETDLIY